MKAWEYKIITSKDFDAGIFKTAGRAVSPVAGVGDGQSAPVGTPARSYMILATSPPTNRPRGVASMALSPSNELEMEYHSSALPVVGLWGGGKSGFRRIQLRLQGRFINLGSKAIQGNSRRLLTVPNDPTRGRFVHRFHHLVHRSFKLHQQSRSQRSTIYLGQRRIHHSTP